MASSHDHYSTIFAPFNLAPQTNHMSYIAAADEMTEGEPFVFWKYLLGTKVWQTVVLTDCRADIKQKIRAALSYWCKCVRDMQNPKLGM